MTAPPTTGLVVVLVGTDHHPFERLVRWTDDAAAAQPSVRYVVQHGASPAPRVAEGHAFLPHASIMALVRRASAVVCHGGPGTIMDARGAGHVPVCVPRDPALGEHVDGHQQRFAALVGRAGVVTHAQSERDFRAAVDVLLAAQRSPSSGAPLSPATADARRRLAVELDQVVGQVAGRRPGRPRPATAARGRVTR